MLSFLSSRYFLWNQLEYSTCCKYLSSGILLHYLALSRQTLRHFPEVNNTRGTCDSLDWVWLPKFACQIAFENSIFICSMAMGFNLIFCLFIVDWLDVDGSRTVFYSIGGIKLLSMLRSIPIYMPRCTANELAYWRYVGSLYSAFNLAYWIICGLSFALPLSLFLFQLAAYIWEAAHKLGVFKIFYWDASSKAVYSGGVWRVLSGSVVGEQ